MLARRADAWAANGTTRTTFGKLIPTEGPTFPGWPESPNGSCSSTPDSAILPATPSVAIRRRSLQHGSRKQKLPRPAVVSRQLDAKGRAAAELAFDADVPAKGVRQVLDNRQTQPGAAQLARAGLVNT